MKQIKINNTTELLEFIKLDEVTVVQATQIVGKALNVIIVKNFTKEQLINETKKYIINYCQDSNYERPLFL